jgi:hypothetical protein
MVLRTKDLELVHGQPLKASELDPLRRDVSWRGPHAGGRPLRRRAPGAQCDYRAVPGTHRLEDGLAALHAWRDVLATAPPR